ncbi:MAG: phage terminase large subunit, partial [Syntrophomonadaceae bacterium]|nr:phage terminase large subunit [Syntrophomonadaceae bacterium]
AANNSWQARELSQHPAYQAIFPDVMLRGDSKAKDEWKTSAGGVVYAAGSGGTITGYGAGKHRDGFGGCFPVGTRVWTESGLIPIDRIVRERMTINVWAFDYAGGMALRPVVAWHENPPNDIWRVTFDDGAIVECTQDHRFWTNRGWVRADSLGVDDCLPRVNGGIQGLNHVGINPKRGSGGLDPAPVLPSCSVGPVGDGEVSMAFGQDGSEVGLLASTSDHGLSACDGLPCVAAPDLINDGGTDAILRSQIVGSYADSVVDGQCLVVGEHGGGVDFGLAESAMPLAVDDVRSARVVSQVGESVVRGVSVGVANVRTFRALANEGQHHKRVNRRIADLGFSGQADADVPATFPARLEQLSGLRIRIATSGIGDHPAFASDPSVVADGIEPFISGYRKPVLVERVRHDDVTFCLTVDDYHNFTIESGLVVKNCILIDDPHKADEARSDVMRANVIEWFQNTLESRKNSPETPIILIMQRLHEDDLSGWLLKGGNGEQWDHICLSALRDDGSALWPDKHTADDLRRMQDASPYTFAGQYQQRPAPAEGGVIKPDNLVTIDALPAGQITWMRGWDLASTTDGDWTAGGKIGKLPDGRFVIADMVRVRCGPDERDAAILNTARRDGALCPLSIPQDPGQAGKTQVLYLTRQLSGFRVRSSPESGDKVTRAEPLAAQINAGNVMILRGDWNDQLINEMRMFPNGSFDDQIDALSRAFSELIGGANLGTWAKLA